MSTIPTGTVTFLFTDIEGSTRLAQKHPEKWENLRKRHDDILRSAMHAHHGFIFQIIGDAFCVAFPTASDAIRSAVRAQCDLFEEEWGDTPVKVRMGIHTGQAEVQENRDYHGYLSLSRVQRLMSAAHGGQVLVSLAAQDLVRDDLPENASLRDMGERRLKDLIRPEHIFQLIIANLPADFPPIKTLDAYRHNLPLELTTFIGREKEMAEVRQAVSEHRLVTLTGAGGTGKTRLSLHVAADMLDQFPAGVWFVELAALTNPELIPQTILSALSIGDQPGSTSSLQLLIDYLHEKQLLLLIDNCEHLIAAAAKLVKILLTRAAGLKILATSREALGVEGEVSWYVPSLSFPDTRHLPGIEGLSQYEAVNLFVDRAILSQPHFTVTSDNAPSIAQICYRLDGIPLAIELAAARVKVLDVEQIASRLDDRFRLLTGGSRTVLPRHQTLRATIDWSYDLLSDQEKVLLRRLAIFAGGWTLEAAEKVCVMEEERMDVLEVLARLVEKSLVILENSSGQARYHMLEMTRQYAYEELMLSGEAELVRDLYCDWYRKLTESYINESLSPNELIWSHRLNDELDNLRAVLEWSFGPNGKREIGTKMVGELGEFLPFIGNTSEALYWLEKAEQETRGQEQSLIRATVLLHYVNAKMTSWKDCDHLMLEECLEILGNLGDEQRVFRAYVLAQMGDYLCFGVHDFEAGCKYIQQAIDICRDAHNKQGQGFALRQMSWVKSFQRDFEAAIALAEEAAALYRACGAWIDAAFCEKAIGSFYQKQGNFQEAKRCFLDAVKISREYAYKGLSAEMLAGLGDSCRCLDEYTEAETYYRESLALRQETGVRLNEFIPDDLNLGYTVLHHRDDQQAAVYFSKALELSKECGDKDSMVLCLAGFAAVAACQGNAKDSAVLYGAVDTHVQRFLADWTNFSHFTPANRREFDRYQASCRAQLGDSAFESAFEQGRGMSLDAAAAFALERAIG